MTDTRRPGDAGDDQSIVAHQAVASATMVRPRIFILSEVRLYREGVLMILGRTGAVDILGAGAPPEAFASIAEMAPDVVVLDASSHNGLSLSRHVREIAPRSKIVAFAISGADQHVIACAEAGISAFVTRDGSPEDLVGAVHQAMRGELVCSPRQTALLLGRVAALSAGRTQAIDVDVLTPREREIVVLVEQGLSNKEIARRLRVGTPTVKNHVHNILEKLRVRRRGEVGARMRQGTHDDWSAIIAGTAALPPLKDDAR
jgi:two-component system, NarL family, nitrate/nitrite response regulator NarL